MQEKTITQQQKTSSLESNDQMTSMMPPKFGFSDGAADGGDGGDKKAPQHLGFKGTPMEAEVATWPGEVVLIHSPCYSQEIEAIALAASGNPEMYEEAAAAMDAKIEECLHRKFQNSAGEENQWADDKLHGTVSMNAENWAATSNGKKGWPKLVIFTYWNDPSNPEKGGFNYSHIIYFPIAEMFPEEVRHDLPGGSIMCGDGGGSGPQPDLGHTAKHVDIIEWLPIVAKTLGQMAGMKPDIKTMGNTLPALIQRLQKLAEDAEKITSKVNEMGKANDENENLKTQKETVEKERYVEIDGKTYERKKVYHIKFRIGNVAHSGEKTPQWFLDNYADKPYSRLEFIEI